MILGRTAVGYEEELDRRLSYDPARARELLAEAGYADGFDVALDCSNFRPGLPRHPADARRDRHQGEPQDQVGRRAE